MTESKSSSNFRSSFREISSEKGTPDEPASSNGKTSPSEKSANGETVSESLLNSASLKSTEH